MTKKKRPAARKGAVRKRRAPVRHRGRPHASRIPENQRNLPAGFHRRGGHAATMMQVVDPGIRTVDGATLTPVQQKHLTIARIALQQDVQFGTLDDGVVDKERAIREVLAETPLGQSLVEIERRTMEFVAQSVRRTRRKHRPAAARKRRT